MKISYLYNAGLSFVLLVALCSFPVSFGMQPVDAQGARLRPPDAVTCPRNDLTAFTGLVTFYRRSADRVVIKMHTDENTTERFVVRYTGDDPSKIFLLLAEPFKQEDLKRIESTKGALQKGMRATVWVCKDGTKIVDWQPRQE